MIQGLQSAKAASDKKWLTMQIDEPTRPLFDDIFLIFRPVVMPPVRRIVVYPQPPKKGGTVKKRSAGWLSIFAVVSAASLHGSSASAAGEATVIAKVRSPKDMGQQLYDLYRPYFGSGALFKGDLFFQICKDASCKEITFQKQVEAPGLLLSTGFPKAITVSGVPANGDAFVRFALDTTYSQGLNGKGWGPIDVVQSGGGADARPSLNNNLVAGSTKVNLTAGKTADMGEVLIGTIQFSDPSFAPSNEDGYLFAAASGNGSFRNAMKILDTANYSLLPQVTAKLKGADFSGDLCGFVDSPGDELYVTAVGNEGAYLFTFNKKTKAFASTEPVWIPHPDCKDGKCPAKLDVENYPWLCRGALFTKGAKRFVALVDYKGAGALPMPTGITAAVVDVSGGKLVATYNYKTSPFTTPKRLLRGVAAIDDTLFFYEPSWSRQLGDEKISKKSVVYAVPTNDAGGLDFDKRKPFQVDPADDVCGSTNHWAPGIRAISTGAGDQLAIGTDNGITFMKKDGSIASKVDLKEYGTLITSFGVSPDKTSLFAMPNCKSSVKKATVLRGVGTTRTNLDRHAIAVLNISGKGAPELKLTNRDFDEDGKDDGGIDLEYLYLKRDLLRWCPDCTGSVPPTTYTGPEITVGNKSVFMRGTGIQGANTPGGSISSTGLGQVGDVGVYDIEKGKGVMFRKFNLLMDGPSSRWGYDLHPENPVKDFHDDVSVSAILFVKK